LAEKFFAATDERSKAGNIPVKYLSPQM